MSSRITVAIAGASGYVGAGLLRRLVHHPNVELCAATSRRYAGRSVADVYPQLEGLIELSFEDRSVSELAETCDVIFLALPHKVSAGVVAALFDGTQPLSSARIIDMSGDFRLDDAESYATYYGQTHPCPELLGQFVYGLSEWERSRLREARYVANPGCFATAIGMGLAPLAAKGMLPERVTVVAATGSSGSGAEPKAGTHHPERTSDYKLYKVLNHQHTPEILSMLRRLGAETKLSFIPASAPMARGIYATMHMLTPDPAALAETIRGAYKDARFVRVREGVPRLNWVLHSNFVDIGLVEGDDELVVAVAIDNLVKGAAGQGIQNLNLMMGLDEAAGLLQTPSIP